MRILQINTVVNSGSTGRITEEIGNTLIAGGHESYIGYGRSSRNSKSKIIKIGSKWDFYCHLLKSLFTDRHGFGSKRATKRFIKQIQLIKPDLISLHNIHGYYINIEILFEYIKKKNIPVVWTFHDCWPFTGHCTFNSDCNNCKNCQSKYPKSIFLNQSTRNFKDKKLIFNDVKRLRIITPSLWLKNLVKQSFLNYPVDCINNGVDLNLFKPTNNFFKLKRDLKLDGKKIILGVASTWDQRKGLSDFLKLASIINKNYLIILIGLSISQMRNLPENIFAIKRTESTIKLADYYCMADVFVNPTYKDNFPTTNIESLACGTPVITYETGGSPEAINVKTGRVVKVGDIYGIWEAIKELSLMSRDYYTNLCRTRAQKFFNKDDRFKDYLTIYKNILNHNV